jgi:hypothetical protein
MSLIDALKSDFTTSDNQQSYGYNASQDDDDLLSLALSKLAEWCQLPDGPGLTAIQQLFHDLIQNGASPMLKDKVIQEIIETYSNDLGGKRALSSTWTEIARQVQAERVQSARTSNDAKDNSSLTSEQKIKLREALWPFVSELALSPDLIKRVIDKVQSMGVVNEAELISLVYIAATSRVLTQPINPLIKGSSSGGKSFTTTKTLELIGQDFVSYLSTSSALSLIYDERPLSHTVLVVFEANQLQADENSTFSMLLRTLISEGRIIHQTTVEDSYAPNGRRVARIERKGPISLMITTTGELHAENETRMLSFNVTESPEQTRGVIAGLAASAAGKSGHHDDLKVYHDFQTWIALGPQEAVIPYAEIIAANIPPAMVRFRRDAGSLFNFIKASAILHQAQRQIDDQGRVIADIEDYRIAYPIFTKIMAQSAGQMVPENVRVVVELIASRASDIAPKAAKGKFTRPQQNEAGTGVEISSEQIGLATGIGRIAAHRAVKSAIDLGFLVNNETRPRKPYRLVVKHNIDEADKSLLPHPDSISEDHPDA